MGRSTFKYRQQWEREWTESGEAGAAFVKVGGKIRDAVKQELRRSANLNHDIPAREYLAELDVVATRTGARVLTTASRAHFVEFGTRFRRALAPMRIAARRFGNFKENRR